ncbi:MAG: hypothetical protein ACOH5I_15080 [Oligoflexus sp.]
MIALFLYTSLPASLKANINHNPLTPYNESICFSDSSSYRQSHKPSVPPFQLRRIREQEDKIYREMILLGYSKEDVIEMLEEDCPTDVHPTNDGSEEYLRTLSFINVTINQLRNEKNAFAQYKEQCSRMGYESLTFEEYNLELDAAATGLSNPYGDFRLGWDGWAHSHDCNECKDKGCKPHSHKLNEFGRKIAVEKLVQRDVKNFRENYSGLKSTTTVGEGTASIDAGLGIIPKLLAKLELKGEFKFASNKTSDDLTPEKLNALENESRDHWTKASDYEVLQNLEESDGNAVSGTYSPPEESEKEHPKKIKRQ